MKEKTMFKNTIRSLTVTAGLVAALAMTIGASGVAFATIPTPASQDTAGSLAVTGTSGLAISAPTTLSFTGVTLDGLQHTTTNAAHSFGVDVTDATGLAGGWNVSLAATTFTSGSNTLANAGTLSVTGVTPSDLSSPASGTMPTSTITPTSGSPVAVTTAATSPTAAPMYNAGAGTGIGSFGLDTQLSLYLPASTVAGTYTSTITVAVASKLTS